MQKPIIGLAGGICAGKSLVGRILAELGCGVICSDELNHQLLREQSVREKIHKLFGNKVLDEDGRPDRRKLAELAFGDDQARQTLQQLLHPLIDARRLQLTEQYRADPNIKAIVIDSPLLFEVDLDKKCDKVIFVDADKSVRLTRAKQRGWVRQELARREEKQLSPALKRQQSHYIIVNNSSIKACRQQVEEIFSQIISPFDC